LKAQIQPNRWSCLLTAFAIALDENVDKLVEEIGHDGSERIWSAPHPNDCRGFHIQEIIECCLFRKVAVVPIEPRPSLTHPLTKQGVYAVPVNDPASRMTYHMQGAVGVLTGITENNSRHALTWNRSEIIDPSDGLARQTIHPEWQIECFWKLIPMSM